MRGFCSTKVRVLLKVAGVIAGIVGFYLTAGVSLSSKFPTLFSRGPPLPRARPTPQVISAVEIIDQSAAVKVPETRRLDNDLEQSPDEKAVPDEKSDGSPHRQSSSKINCDSVGAKIAASPSLSELLKKTTRVLWNENTRNLSPSVRSFWMKLNSHNQGNLDAALDDLFRVVAGQDVFAEWKKRGCLRCAIVGNSKNMLGSGYGSSIDEKDVVFRMNRCPTKGYEKDVGSKTTFHIIYPESAIGYQPGGRLMLVPFKVPDLHWLTSALSKNNTIPDNNSGYWRRPPVSIDTNASQVVILHPDLLYETKMGVHGRTKSYPSTGLMILFASLHLCDEVYVYGYGLGPRGEFGHYYDKSAGDSQTAHDGDVETQIRERLEKENIIRVYKGHYPT